MKIDIDTTQLDKFRNDLNKIRAREFKEKYFDYLKDNIQIEKRLRKNINNLVYSSERQPEMYKWTYRLLGAVRAKEENGKLILYMDDKWLEQNKEGYMSDATGWDPSVVEGSGASKSYAERVEEGFEYNNVKYPNHEQESTAPTLYFQKTFEEIEGLIDAITVGNKPPQILLEPILKVW
ncbi:MAG: hypothetical protein ACQEQF_01730 [Bacillota bacterium]